MPADFFVDITNKNVLFFLRYDNAQNKKSREREHDRKKIINARAKRGIASRRRKQFLDA
jgi:hypothetical protein